MCVHVSWVTDTDGSLEHSPSGGSLYYKGPTLQKIIRGGFGGPFLIVTEYQLHLESHSRAWGHKNNEGLVSVPFGKADGTHINTRSGRDICSHTAGHRRGSKQSALQEKFAW